MHILITGGNKGIGLEATKLFINAGWQVTVIARQASDLQLDCAKHDIDLTDIVALKELPSLVGEVDVLVNNAAIVNIETFDSYDPVAKETILKLNLEAPVELMTVFATSLRKRSGRIINIGSIAGEIGHPDVW